MIDPHKEALISVLEIEEDIEILCKIWITKDNDTVKYIVNYRKFY